MVHTKSRIRLLAIVLALVAIATIIALSLSLRSNADSGVTKFNVYLAETEADALSFATASADTGFSGTEFDGIHDQFVGTNTKDAIKALQNVKSAITACGSPDAVQLNIWILKDTTNGNYAPSDGKTQSLGTNNNYILGESNAQFRLFGTGTPDVMIHVTGVPGYGTASSVNPTVEVVTWVNRNSKYAAVTDAYLGNAYTFKNITFKTDTATQIFCQGHELYADEGVQINRSNGTHISRVVASSYHNASSSVINHMNGVGQYGSYKPESFAGKITLKSGHWGEVCASCGHPGIGTGATSYNFDYMEKSDYYFIIDGAQVDILMATTNGGRSFVGGPTCTLHYELKSGAVAQVFAGPYGDATATVSSNVPTDTTRQYFNVEVNTYDGVIIGQIMGRFGKLTDEKNPSSNPLFVFGDTTYNFYGGTFNHLDPVFNNVRSSISSFSSAFRAVQGATWKNAAGTTVGWTDRTVYLGKVKMTVGDPKTGKGPTFNVGSMNHMALVFATTVGLSSQGSTAQFINEPIYKEVYNSPKDTPTMGEWAKEHAGVEFEMYGGSINKMQVQICTEYSAGTKFTMKGGNIDTLEFNNGYSTDAGAKGHLLYGNGLEMNLSGGTIRATQFGSNFKGICGDVKINATGIAYDAAPDYSAFGTTIPLIGNLNLSFTDCTMPALNIMKDTTKITGNLNITLQGSSKVENLSTLVNATAGTATVTGDLTILMKDSAEITQLDALVTGTTVKSGVSFTMEGSSKVKTLSSLVDATADTATVTGGLSVLMKDSAEITQLDSLLTGTTVKSDVSFTMKGSSKVKTLSSLMTDISLQGNLSFTMEGDSKVETLDSIVNATSSNATVVGNVNITLQDNAEITQFTSFLYAANSKYIYVGGTNTSNIKSGDINLTMKGNALLQHTVDNMSEDESKHTVVDDKASYPQGIYLVGGRSRTSATAGTVYALNDLNQKFEGGTIRLINNYTPATDASSDSKAVTIFLGGATTQAYGDVNQTFSGGFKIEEKQGSGTATCGGIYFAANATTYRKNYNVTMEDCIISFDQSAGVVFGNKTLTGCYYGTRTITLGSETESNKYPVFQGISTLNLASNWGAFGSSSSTPPATASEKDAVVYNIYNVETPGNLLLNNNSAVNSKNVRGYINGNVKTTIKGGTVGGTLSFAREGGDYIMGNMNTTITGGSFGSIFLGQCLGTNKVSIDMTNVTAGSITTKHVNLKYEANSTSSTPSYEVKGNLDLTISNCTPETDVMIISSEYAGDVSVKLENGTVRYSKTASAPNQFQVVSGAKLHGNLTFEATGTTFPGTVLLSSGTSVIDGNIKTTLSGVTITNNFFAGGVNITVGVTADGVTTGGNITTTVKDGSTIKGIYRGGAQKGNILGTITNNIEGLTVNSYYYGGNGADNNTTVSVAAIKNNITGLVAKNSYYGGSEYGAIKGDVENIITGLQLTGSFYGGSKNAGAKIGGNITNTITGNANNFVGNVYCGCYAVPVDGMIKNTISDLTIKGKLYGGHYGNSNHSLSIGNGIVNEFTNLHMISADPTASSTDPQSDLLPGSYCGVIEENKETGYAIYTTINGLNGIEANSVYNGGLYAGSYYGAVNGDVYLSIANTNQRTNRHFMIGNLFNGYTVTAATADSPAVYGYFNIKGDVTVDIESGTYGSIFMASRSNTAATENYNGYAVEGNVTLNVKGGSLGAINKGFAASGKKYPANVAGNCAVNIYTTVDDVTLRGAVPAINAGSAPIDEINLFAGDFTLYKYNYSIDSTTWEKVGEDSCTSTPLTFTSLNTDAGTLKFATIGDWVDKVVHLTILSEDALNKVSVISGPITTLKGSFDGTNSVWTTVSYAIVEDSFSRSIQLGDTYAVRYLLTKEQIDFLGDRTTAIVNYTVKVNGNTFKEGTATLQDGADVEDSSGNKPYQNYYFFLVEGIFAKDYAKAEITVTVSLGEHTGTLENDTVEQALQQLGSEVPGYKELADAITDYAKALEVYFDRRNGNENAEYKEITLSEEVLQWADDKSEGSTDASGELLSGVHAYGVNLVTTDTLSIKFWLKADSAESVPESAEIVGKEEGIAVETNKKGEEPTGFYTVTYTCGAGDLATMLTMKLEGASDGQEFRACPVSYAKSLYGDGNGENSALAAAIIEYAYQVSHNLSLYTQN